MLRPWLLKFGLAALGIVAALAIGEACLQATVWFRGSRDEEPGTSAELRDKLMRPEERTGWLPRKGARIEKTDAHGRSFVVRINDTGQRGPEVGARQQGQARILFLGDSYTMADQVPEEETFVERTGRLLTEDFSRGVQTINGGVNGYGTYQEMAYYRYYGRPIEANLVVLVFFVGNDFRDNMITTRQGSLVNPVFFDDPHRFDQHRNHLLRGESRAALRDPLSWDAVPLPDQPWVASLQRRFLLARMLGARYAKLKGRMTGNMALIDLTHRYHFYEIGFYQGREDPYFSSARELTIECLEQLRRWVRWDGAEFAVVVLPSPLQVAPSLWRRTLSEFQIEEEDLGPIDFYYPNRLIATFCTENGVPYLDLTSAFAAAENSEELYLSAVGDRHLSAAGHELIAAELARALAAGSWALCDPAIQANRDIQRLIREGRWVEAQQQLDRATNRTLSPLLQVAKGDLARLQGDWHVAVRHYRRALDQDRESLNAWEGLGVALREIGNHSAALQAWRHVLELQPNWWPYYIEIERHSRALGLAEADSASTKAESIFSAGAPVRASWWAEHVSRGVRLMNRNQVAAAEQEFQWAIRLQPTEPVAYYNLGWIYQQTARPELARDQYRRILEIAPDFQLARQRLDELR